MADTTYKIPFNETPSSIFGNFALPKYESDFSQPHRHRFLDVKKLTNSVVSGWQAVVKTVNQGQAFFKQWFTDDPIPATAGLIAAGLTLGVVVIVGGAAIASVPGGISALRSLSLIGKLKAGLLVALGGSVIGGLIRFAVRGVQFLWNFNWNITDKGIREQQQGLINSMYGQLGEALGSSVGTLLCGAAPVELIKRSHLVKVNPMLLAKIREVTEFDPQNDQYGELYEEMMENLKALVNMGTRVAGQIAFMESYKNLRKWIKGASKDLFLYAMFPGLSKIIEKWGAEGSQAWSFASAIEDSIEKIENKNIQSFTEEFVQSFMDSCTESTMIISYVF